MKVTCLDKSTRHLSPQADEHLPDFPATILSADQRLSSRSTALLAHRHYHIYDWTRLSFYDNVPSALNYLSEPLVVQDCSPTSTSSTDRQDSGLETSSVERHVDTLALPSNHLDRSLSSLSSCSSSNSHETNTLSTSSRLPTSRKIRVKWHSFTRTHRPSFNSSKYHLGQMSVGQLFALRRAASMRIHELFDTTRVFSSGKERSRSNQTNKIIPSRQCLIATAFSAVPKLIIRRHQQRKVCAIRQSRCSFVCFCLSFTRKLIMIWRNPSLDYRFSPWLNARAIRCRSPLLQRWNISDERQWTVLAFSANRKWKRSSAELRMLTNSLPFLIFSNGLVFERESNFDWEQCWPNRPTFFASLVDS